MYFINYQHFIKILAFILIISSGAGCRKEVQPSTETPSFYRGADLSFLPEMEQAGTKFFDGDSQNSALKILKKYGMNLVRLRLWHTPLPEHNNHSSLSEVMAFAKQIKAENLQFLLDFHYSDTWADPGKQSIPNAWKALNVNQLGDSIQNYTQKVIQKLKDQNTLPDMIQIGNETNSGMLWDAGRVGGAYESNWGNYALLIKQAIAGVRAVDKENKIKIMLHFAGYSGADWFFGNLQTQKVDYDIIGLSHYPQWHGKSFTELKTKLNELISKYNKEILIVETSYPWTLEWNDQTNNFIGLADQIMSEYAASPTGQKQFMSDLKALLKSLDKGKGIGFCYWEPTWTAFKGKNAINGSAWENQTLFDFQNKALPAIETFGE